MAFLGGFQAFPGGQREESDSVVPVDGCDDPERATMIACAVRELFEELGVLIARGVDALTSGQRASLLDDFESGRMTFAEMLAHYGLRLEADDFTFVGRWVTPPFSPRRFDTWFFLAGCPAKQVPEIRSVEFAEGGWITARDAFESWRRSEILGAPPVIHAVKTLAGGLTADLIDRFLSVPQAHGEPVRRIEFRPGFICFPVRTPTKPPATHTNCYLVGHGEVVVIDPASPYEDEQAELARLIDDLRGRGRVIRQIILTHLHPDHIGGVNALVSHLEGLVTVSAHRLTAKALQGSIKVDSYIEDGDSIELVGEPSIALRAMHTPGHARGHLCFYHEPTGALITGDNIVGLGSVLIDPPEGRMRDYLASLERMAALPNLSVLFGAHGPAIGNPREKIQEFIRHRLEREDNILRAVRIGASTVGNIVQLVYTDVDPRALPMAERAVLAHLEKLEEDNLVVRANDGTFSAKDDPLAANDQN
jgi:ribonuclease/clavin/mitogillin